MNHKKILEKIEWYFDIDEENQLKVDVNVHINYCTVNGKKFNPTADSTKYIDQWDDSDFWVARRIPEDLERNLYSYLKSIEYLDYKTDNGTNIKDHVIGKLYYDENTFYCTITFFCNENPNFYGGRRDDWYVYNVYIYNSYKNAKKKFTSI